VAPGLKRKEKKGRRNKDITDIVAKPNLKTKHKLYTL
jgi:hypothetical protein